MKKIVCIELYNNNSEEELTLQEIDNERILSIMKRKPEGTLFVFDACLNSSTSIIMCPGGGYKQINFGHEGIDFAEWFAQRNITYAVLKYRFPGGNPNIVHEDILNAMNIMRKRFSQQSQHLGVMGASIGGYYAAVSAIMPKKEQSDFQILMYSVTSLADEITNLHCRECLVGKNYTADQLLHFTPIESVTPQTSRAFIVASADDPAVNPLNSILYAAQLQRKKVPISLHIYPSGGHSFGFNDDYTYKQQWLSELDKWLQLL